MACHRFDPTKILLAGELEDLRIDPRADRRPDGTLLLTPIRHGAYYDAVAWASFDPTTRYAARVHATAQFARSSGHLYSHWSAAAVWALPIIEPWPCQVHLTMTGGTAYSSGLVIRHVCAVTPAYVVVDGIRVTAVPRTVIDLAREGSLQSAVAAADHALRQGMCTRGELEEQLAALPPGSVGIRRARTAVALADPRAESPLESMSRVAMYELRLPRPELQVPLCDARGEFGRGDFGWAGLVGECDGRAKYIRYLHPGDVVIREKRREDRIRQVGLDVARWGWDDALGRVGMLRVLEEKGIRPMPRRRWL